MVDLAWSPDHQYRLHFRLEEKVTPALVAEKIQGCSPPSWLTKEVIEAIWPQGSLDDWWDPTVYEAQIEEERISPKTGIVRDGKLVTL